jgi:protein tyrosine phosphatase (PTP) superfamily phosphohydrolase (DUF442 family)
MLAPPPDGKVRNKRSMSPRVLAAVCLAGLLAAIFASFAVRSIKHNYHLATVQEGVLYRDGFRSADQFAATLDTVHPHTVVALIDANEMADGGKPQFAHEKEICAAHGATLDRIPVKLGGWPSSADIQQFLTIVTDKQNQPVLVHCAQGVRRTGFFVAAYQESVLGYDKARAGNAILTFGHSDNTTENIKRFIENYDPRTQTVSGGLGHGSE